MITTNLGSGLTTDHIAYNTTGDSDEICVMYVKETSENKSQSNYNGITQKSSNSKQWNQSPTVRYSN